MIIGRRVVHFELGDTNYPVILRSMKFSYRIRKINLLPHIKAFRLHIKHRKVNDFI